MLFKKAARGDIEDWVKETRRERKDRKKAGSRDREHANRNPCNIRETKFGGIVRQLLG